MARQAREPSAAAMTFINIGGYFPKEPTFLRWLLFLSKCPAATLSVATLFEATLSKIPFRDGRGS